MEDLKKKKKIQHWIFKKQADCLDKNKILNLELIYFTVLNCVIYKKEDWKK